MSVPVRGTIRPVTRTITVYDKNGNPVTHQIAEFTENLAAQVGERLIALEKAASGGTGGGMLAPEAVPFGPGSGTDVTNVTNITQGVTDHGALTGLEDDDHPQYVQHGEATPALPHQHQTGPSTDLTALPGVGGASGVLADAAHTHQRSIEVEDDGTSLGAVQAVNVQGQSFDLEIEPNLTGSLLTDIYGRWPLDEEAGNRHCVLGTGPDLVPTGIVPTVAGRFGRAVSSTEATTYYLSATLSPALALSAGLSVALWFRWPAFSSNDPKSMLMIDNGVGGAAITKPAFTINRFYDSDFLETEIADSLGTSLVYHNPPRLGPFAVNTWHLLVLTYDASTGRFLGRVDEGCLIGAPTYPSVWPANKLEGTLTGSLAALNASTFSRLSLMLPFSGLFVPLEGYQDELVIAPRCWTDAEVALLWSSTRATVSVNSNSQFRPLPHQHMKGDLPDLSNDANFLWALQRLGG